LSFENKLVDSSFRLLAEFGEGLVAEVGEAGADALTDVREEETEK